MKKEELEIIDQFINGFEPWQSNIEYMKKLWAGGEDRAGCVMCGIEPEQVKKLRDAVEKLRDKTP